jgi:hypothetical protein
MLGTMRCSSKMILNSVEGGRPEEVENGDGLLVLPEPNLAALDGEKTVIDVVVVVVAPAKEMSSSFPLCCVRSELWMQL